MIMGLINHFCCTQKLMNITYLELTKLGITSSQSNLKFTSAFHAWINIIRIIIGLSNFKEQYFLTLLKIIDHII